MISLIIPHCPSPEHDAMLKKCLDSMSGYDEVIVVANEPNTIGFTKAVNIGLSLAKGDYLMVVNNDIEWVSGDLRDLCMSNTITSPYMNGQGQRFWGCFFVIPRGVYEKVGELDVRYYLYCSDVDYAVRARKAQVECQSVSKCHIKTLGAQTTRLLGNQNVHERRDASVFINQYGMNPDQAFIKYVG